MATVAEHHGISALSTILPVTLLASLIGVLAVMTGLIGTGGAGSPLPGPQTVIIEPRTFTYRSDGDFVADGSPIDAPLTTVAVAAPLHVMKFQVSVGEYALCVTDGACKAAEGAPAGSMAVPVTGVSYSDAQAYAEWFSTRTGQVWRLPTDMEWAFAAGSRFADDALGIAMDNRNPAVRWIANYEREAARKAGRVWAAQPTGTFGENEFGVADIGGNVWEWTETCHRRIALDGDGTTISEASACKVFVLEGKHRAPMSFFIRDAKGGGCSVGTPPDNLGFRLVRDTRWYAPLIRAFSTSAARRT